MVINVAASAMHEASGAADLRHDVCVFTKPECVRGFRLRVKPLCALVVSSDEGIQQKLADTITQCGLVAFRAFTVGESRRILNRQEICVVVCDDRLIDGKYGDLLQAAKTLRTRIPVIVVSLAGDWPDYLRAIDAGAFDFLAYPPIRGELPRVVRHALESRTPSSTAEATHSELWKGEKR